MTVLFGFSEGFHKSSSLICIRSSKSGRRGKVCFVFTSRLGLVSFTLSLSAGLFQQNPSPGPPRNLFAWLAAPGDTIYQLFRPWCVSLILIKPDNQPLSLFFLYFLQSNIRFFIYHKSTCSFTSITLFWAELGTHCVWEVTHVVFGILCN